MELRPSLVAASLLIGILVMALTLRVVGVNWDDGQHLHPDERQITFVVNKLAFPWPPDGALLLDAQASPLNPHFFSYGSLPLYGLALVGAAVARAGWLANVLVGHGPRPELAFIQDAASYAEINLIGRVISALFDTGTVALLYVLGSRLYGRLGGVIAASGYAVTALAVQQAHFFVVDPVLTFLIVLTVLVAYAAAEAGSLKHSALLGLLVGATVATKVSAAPIALVVLLAHVVTFDRSSRSIRWRPPETWGAMWPHLGLAGLVAMVSFAVFEPYALLDPQEFMRDVGAQSAMVRGMADFPYTRQYTHTTPYLYWIGELVRWQMAPPLGLLACAGAAFACVRWLRDRRSPEILYLSWLVPYFGLTGAFLPKYPRYMLPAVPFMLLAAAGLVAWASRRWRREAHTSWVTAIVLAVSALYCVAYDHVYVATNTRVAASQWIFANVAPGSTLVGEHWDDALPLALPDAIQGRGPGNYQQAELPIYDPDSAAKRALMSGILSRGQYVVLSSNIVRGSVLRLPERYPLMRQYYAALESGKLGYREVASFSSYPRIFGVTLVDDGADLNWCYYDHPKVVIYQNVGHLTPAQIEAAMGPAPAEPIQQPPAELLSQAKLQVSRADLAANLARPAFSAMFPPDSLGMRLPVLVWLVNLELLGLIVLPLAALVSGALPDSGACLAKTLGWLLLTFGTWWLASVRWMSFTRGSMTVVVVALFLVGALLFMRRPELRLAMLRGWKFAIAGEVLFFVAFFAFLLIRMANPDTWHLWRGGERPMELAYVNGILRSAYFPPFDPWLSGTYNNYYYFGLAMLAVWFRWTDIVPTTGWNLADPTLFGLTAEAVFGIGVAVATGIRNEARRGGSPPGPRTRAASAPSLQANGDASRTELAADGAGLTRSARDRAESPPSPRGAEAAWRLARRAYGATSAWLASERGPLLAGLGSCLLAVVLGNVASVPWIVENLRKAGEASVHGSTPLLAGLRQVLVGIAYTIATRGSQFPQFDYFGLTRVIPNTINEFPFFSFLYGDIHPHVIDYAMTTLALGVLTSLALGGAGDLVPIRRRRLGGRSVPWLDVSAPLLSCFLVASLATGVLGPSNIWDLPIYLGLAPLAVVVCQWRAQGRPFWRACLEGLGWGLAVAVAGRLIFRPFYAHFVALSGGLGLPMQHTSLGPFLEVYALLFFIAASFALAELGRWTANDLYLVVPGLVLGAIVRTVPVFLLTTFVVVLVAVLARKRLEPARLMVVLIMATAAALVLGTELFFVRDPLQGGDAQRMNTVFKFGVQAWLLFSVASGPALYALFQRFAAPSRRLADQGDWTVAPEWRAPYRELAPIAGGEDVPEGVAGFGGAARPATLERAAPPPSAGGQRQSEDVLWEPAWWERVPWLRAGKVAWAIVLACLVFAAAIYPLAGTAAKVHDRYVATAPCGQPGMTCEGTPLDPAVSAAYLRPSLDGVAYMRLAYPGDYAAIMWLQGHVRGNPVIAEAFRDIYAWYSRVSWNTGLPTLLGWDNQERQFHAAELVDARRPVLDSIYNSRDVSAVLGLLHQYHVSYVYVGPVERATYDPLGVAKFGAMVGRGVERVYEAQGVAIYHVTGEP